MATNNTAQATSREAQLVASLNTAIASLEECRSFIRDEVGAKATVRHLTTTIAELRDQLGVVPTTAGQDGLR